MYLFINLFVHLLFTAYYIIYSKGSHLVVDEGVVVEGVVADLLRGSTPLSLPPLTPLTPLPCKFLLVFIGLQLL